MSVPTIPGISAYPELEKKYKRSYRAAQNRARPGCPDCETAQVLQNFKARLEQRNRGQSR
jgi:hypothetical protein